MIGRTIGHLRVLEKLGEGGMGEVYRATDTTLEREVAVKVLPQSFAGDLERLSRFEREAKLLASLNHPNIAHVYGFERGTLEDGSTAHFLAMELVEGEDLAGRLRRGPIPVDETLAIAKQIAEALEDAHEHGIVHRDLKPANVKVTPDGKVKVLDFGLAKAYAGDSGESSPDLSQSPTLAYAGTQAGVILGTAAYMSPEQARGKPVDKRTDIWAFGVLLYEMLTGRQMFGGDTVSDVLAGVLKTEVDLTALPSDAPPAVQSLLRRCLERNPRNRLHDIADARLVIDEALAGHGEPATAAPGVAPSRARQGWLLVGGAAALAAVAVGGWLAGRSARTPVAPLVADIGAPEGEHFQFLGDFGAPVALSPDGSEVAWGAVGSDSKTRLWVRSLVTGAAKRLDNTEGATAPFFSPDGKSLGYFANSKLMIVSMADGSPYAVADAPNGRGGAWAADGTIVFAPDFRSGLARVPATGGTPTPLTTLDGARYTTHRWPVLTPDGKAVVYLAANHDLTRSNESELRWLRLTGGDDHALVRSLANGVVTGGQLLYLRDRTLLAQPMDDAGRLSGSARTVVTDVLVDPSTWRATFAAVGDRLIVAAGGSLSGTHISRVDENGRPLQEIAGDGTYFQLRLSPDGRRLAVTRGTLSDIWLYDLDRGTQSRFTFEPMMEALAVWSRDGRWIYYARSSDRGILSQIARKAVSGAGQPEVLYDTTSSVAVVPEDETPDGAWLLVITGAFPFAIQSDIQWLALDGPRRLVPLLATPAAEVDARLSPDGRWVAFRSNESGQEQIYVIPATHDGSPPRAKWQISVNGGRLPIWSRDGRSIVYLAPGLNLARVDVAPDGAGGLRFGTPQPMFATTLVADQPGYDIAPDGKSFVLDHYGEAPSRPLRLIDGWQRLVQ